MHIVGRLFLCTDDGVCAAGRRSSHDGEGSVPKRRGADCFDRHLTQIKRKDRHYKAVP